MDIEQRKIVPIWKIDGSCAEESENKTFCMAHGRILIFHRRVNVDFAVHHVKNIHFRSSTLTLQMTKHTVK